jgi:excinuclease ABC subunit A
MTPQPPHPLPDRPAPLRILGARQNNLQGLDLEIPHDALVAVTGVSGSGKSSLAFDTLFAEGQWRYLESLPTYARMLLEKTARPAVDGLENVRPAVALEQRNTTRSARSTVGTLTELYDLFRVLFAALGQVTCPSCGAPVRAWTARAAAEEVLARLEGSRVEVEAPLAALGLPDSPRWAADLAARGFARVRLGDRVAGLDDPDLPPSPEPGAAVVLERLRVESSRVDRLARTLDEAFRVGAGLATVRPEGAEPLAFGTRRGCRVCDREVPEPRPVLFSFNHPLGACPTCTGFGALLEWDEEKVVPDPTLTLAGGAVDPWEKPANHWWKEQLEELGPREGIRLDVPWGDLPAEARAKVWRGSGRLEGLDAFFEYLEGKRYKMHVRVFLARYRSPRTCPACRGARLRPEVLAITVAGRSIAEINAMSLRDLAAWVRGLEGTTAERGREVLWRIEERLSTLLRLGLGYLAMERTSRTLSGGEAQRAALARQLSNRLAGTLYVLDEPTVGLHARDVDVLAGVLDELAGRGNTVVFVEHDLSLIRRADHVIELGPGGGREGGRVLYEGAPKGLARADTPTGRHLAAGSRRSAGRRPRPAAGHLVLRGCSLHNLKGIDVAFPLGVLACVTGVSGSGKSTLVADTLVPAAASRGLRGPVRALELSGEDLLREVRVVDQDPMGRTPRSIPLTYVGAYSAVRDVFAGLPASRRLGLTPAHFSFNVKGGRCERCQGTGYEKLEMLFFEDLYVPCDACGGRRFGAEVLAARFQGRSIHEVLGLTVEEGLTAFEGIAKIERPLRALQDLGLGYLVLGQPATTLSGGEAQRLKIAGELLGTLPRGVLYVLDEPTTGLHADDVGRLLATLHRLVDAGNTVVAVEHNLPFVAEADWVIDLGPEGGDDGGEIVDAGTPEEVAGRALGETGRYLRGYLAGTDP